MSTVDEIEFRRLAGVPTVRALLEERKPGVNSDYYPLVDHAAPRERFLKSNANVLLHMHAAPVAVVDILERRPPIAPQRIAPIKAFHDRREGLQAGVASAAWLSRGALEGTAPPMPRDIGLLRAVLWDCATLPPRLQLRDLMHDATAYAAVHLPPRESEKLWSAVRSAPCASRMTHVDRAWLDLFEASGARDAQRMASLGVALSQGDALRDELRSYAIVAGATGLIATNRHVEAREFLAKASGRLPAALRTTPSMQLLRGFAARGPAV
jgi:hypothetical protein